MPYPISATPWPAGSSNQNPAYTGVFIPAIWSAKLIEKFYDATVLAAIANTDYEGEIAEKGDTVHIRTKPTITINDYEVNQELAVQRPSSNLVDLVIDKGKYFNVALDDVMDIQSDLDMMNMWSDDASEQMKINIDTDVLAAISADVDADNSGATAGRLSGNINLGVAATPVSFSSSTAIQHIVNLGLVLDEQNIPETGRWLVLPAWACAKIKLSDLKDASITGDQTSMLRNGRLGMIDRFTLYTSNLLPVSGAEWTAFAGHSHGLTFASQVTKVETIRSERTFATLLRGLQVFGVKVTDGTAIAELVATPG